LQNNIITTVWEAKMDLLSEQRPLSHKLIAICLGGMSLPVEQDKDGDFRLNLSKFNVTAWVCPTLPTELRILCIYNNAVPTGKRETALCFCDVFNQKTKYGHAYLQDTNDEKTFVSYELWWDLENGLASVDFLVKNVIDRAFTHVIELSENIVKHCEF
jgi:hypothetical protein